MDKFSKKTLLSMIGGAGIYGTSANQQVTFKFARTIAKAISSKQDDGALIFAIDSTSSAGAIWAGNDLVSSRVLDYAIADSAEKDHGQKTVTLTYIDATSGLTTKTFDLIDEAGLKAYFTGSKTIALDDNNIYEVITDGTTILVDENDGLKSGLKLVYVPASAASGDDPAVDAHIALSDNSNTELYTIPVASIVGNGVLDHSSYDKQKNELHLFFKTAQAGVFNEVVIPVGEILDINDIFIKNDSSIYLTATADTSVMNLGVLLQDVSTADADHNGLSSAKAIREYVDSKSTALTVEAASRDTYLDASVLSDNNKKVWVAAKVADLTVAKDGNADTTITGTSGKLIDAADAAAKTTSYVNARISEEIDKLGATKDSSANFVKVEVTTEDGDVSVVTVTEKIGSLTGTASAISGTAGLISGDDAASAISTYVEGRLDASIQALDASLNATTNDISIYLTEVDGKVTNIGIEHSNATVTFTAKSGDTPASLTGSGSFVQGTDIEAIKNYVDAVAEAGFDGLDSEVEKKDASNFIGYKVGIVDGKLVDGSCNLTAVFGDYDKTTQTDGIATTAATKNYIDTEIQSLDLLATVANASAIDAAGFVKTTISETDGIVKNESVEVTYGNYGTQTNGIAKTADTSIFVEQQITAALTWQVLS